MKVLHRSFKLGQIRRLEITPAQVVELATLPEHRFPGQRDHAKGFKKKKALHGVLQGLMQVFSAVYILDECRFELIDGYHRGHGIDIGEIHPHPDFPYYLDCYTVPNRKAANALFEQFNNLNAAKKSTCWFESGLRECGMLNLIKSHLVMGPGRAYAVQFAAGVKGSANTKAATIAVIEGLKVVDAYQLNKQAHEIAGSIGVYYAVATHCKAAALVEEFVRAVNAVVYEPSVKTPATDIIGVYHKTLKDNGHKTGGTPNQALFAQGLAAFARFAYTKRRKSRVPTELQMELSRFIELMKSL